MGILSAQLFRRALLATGCLTVAIGLASAPASGETYYVRTTGDDDNNGQSAAMAFATINQAAAVAISGDTVYVGGGTYTDTVYIAGAKQSFLTTRFVGDVLGSNTGDSGPVVIVGAPVIVAGSNYVQIEAFTFRGVQAFPIVWQGSYEGVVQDCTFDGGTNPLLMRDGSLTLDGCSFSNSSNDAIQVDGSARLLVRDCTLSGSGRRGIDVRKGALVTVENSTVSGNGGDGVHVDVSNDEIPFSIFPDYCACSGDSPVSARQRAYDLLRTVQPADPVYLQEVEAAADKILATLDSSLWRDEWHVNIPAGPGVYDGSAAAIQQLMDVLNDAVEFSIIGDEVTVNHPFVAELTVVGAAVQTSNYTVPVTTMLHVGDETYEPWGDFEDPIAATINDDQNPRTYESPDTFEPADVINVSARAWVKHNSSYSGLSLSHWKEYTTVHSSGGSPYLYVLRDGDAVPDVAGYNGQASAASFLQPYITDDDKISLQGNQVIFLFEFNTNLSSAAADFQDLVMLITLRRVTTPLTAEEIANITEVINLLLQADRTLADCAINEATCGGGDMDDLNTAAQHYTDGVIETNTQQWASASSEFKAAWVLAKAATGNQDVDLGAALRDRSEPQPPSGWTEITTPELEIRGSQITGNASGVVVATSQLFAADDTVFSANSQWGLEVRGAFTLNTCTFSENQQGGVRIVGAQEGDMNSVGSTLTNNGEYGVLFEDCQVTMNQSQLAGLSISGSRYILAGRASEITLNGVTLSGGSSAGVSVVDSVLTVQNSTVTQCGYGIAAKNSTVLVEDTTLSNNSVGLYSDQNATVNVRDCAFHSNTVWGAVVYASSASGAAATFAGSTLHNNAGGVSVVNATDGAFHLTSNTLIRDNTHTGLHLHNCSLTLPSQGGGSNWRIVRNDYGISSSQSTLTLSQVHVEESGSYGIHCSASNVRVENCTVNGETGVYADASNHSLSVSGSRFDAATTGSGCGVASYGGDLDVVNSVVAGFGCGIYIHAAIDATVNNSTLANLTDYGVQLVEGSASVTNTILTGSGGQVGLKQDAGTLSHSYNLLYGFANPYAGATAGSHEILKNPRFVDAAHGDFQLAKGSPAINAGMNPGISVLTDVAGNPRPSHAAYEIGAYEFMSNAGSLRVLDWREKK